MNRIQRLVQDREKTNRIMIVLAIITIVCLIINYIFYDQLGIFFFIGIAMILLIGFFIYQLNEYKKPTEDMIRFEEKYENFSKLYVNLTGRPNLDDLMITSVDGRKPVVGKDNYGIFIYIVDKEENLLEEDIKENKIEYVEEISEQKMDKLAEEAERLEKENTIKKEENKNFTDMTDFLYANNEEYMEELEDKDLEKEEVDESENNYDKVRNKEDEYIDDGVNKDELEENKKKTRDKYTRIRIDKRKLEKKLKRKFHTDKDTINLIYEFSKPNSRYALRYFDDVDKFTINNFY